MTVSRSILITGASSGLGEALAHYYAHEKAHLYLIARDKKRLAEVEQACRALGAEVTCGRVDVRDKEGMARWIREHTPSKGWDMVIANAGISGGTAEGHYESTAQLHAIIETNINGVFHTIAPVIEAMQQQKRGQVVMVSSLAGVLPMPSCPAYSASKACLIHYACAMRSHLDHYGITMTVVLPGFITSRMTAVNRFPMPFQMSAEKAASYIARRLEKRKHYIAFPWMMAAALSGLSLLPRLVLHRIVSLLPGKPPLH